MIRINYKESSEVLIQQFRELTKAIEIFISLKDTCRLPWRDLEYIYQYYIKYLYGNQDNTYDFEGELLEYLLKYGEPSIKMILLKFKIEMMSAISCYNQHKEFYDSITQCDLVERAVEFYRHQLEYNCVALSEIMKECSTIYQEHTFKKGQTSLKYIDALQEAIQKSQTSLESAEKFHDAIKGNIQKAANLTSKYRCLLFDFRFFIFGLQRDIDVINKYCKPEDTSRETEERACLFDTDNVNEEIQDVSDTYFSDEVISSIFGLCNGKQFVTSTFEDYKRIFNLQESELPFAVKSNEKQRVYYLIYRMSELLHENRRKTWIEIILSTLSLSKDSYCKKYKEAESVGQKPETEDYVKSIKHIINKYKPE